MTSSYSVQNFSRRVSFVEENFGEFKKPKSFLEVVGGLDALFSSDDVNISLVKAYLSSYDVRKEDLQDFVSFDDKKYTRNLIWEGNGKYNIMLACWDKKQSSSIHDHSTSHCFMKMLDGKLTETTYEVNRSNCKMQTKHKFQLEKNAVGYSNDTFGLHRISNDSATEQAISLHIYSPPFHACHEVDERSGESHECLMKYDELFLEQLSRLQPALTTKTMTSCSSNNDVVFNDKQQEPGRVRPSPNSMKEVVHGLLDLFNTNDVNINEVTSFLESYPAKWEDFSEYAIFDEFKYTRNLIHEGNGKFNLILVCWNKGQKSTIHDHSDSHCFMKTMDGRLCESLYNWPTEEEKSSGAPMQAIRNIELETGSVAYINDSIGLHRVGNVSSERPAVSLHVYSPPFSSCQVFKEQSGHKMKCPMTYHTKSGMKVRHCPKKDLTK